MKIFLVRHGQSQANVEWDVNKKKADHTIKLTEEGHKQAKAAGEWLDEWFNSSNVDYVHGYGHNPFRLRLWHSPYARTRQTAKHIFNAMGEDDRWIGAGMREHLLLAEQQFGLFDGLSDAERTKAYPQMQAYYEKCKKFEGKLWPKMPLGESRFEVCQRVHQAFGTFHRDADKHGIDNLIIVAHGTVNRAFFQMWMHKPAEWMHQEANPKNCSVRLIEDNIDRGYIFEGF
jgi:broad specificity phosphatase PhoE